MRVNLEAAIATAGLTWDCPDARCPLCPDRTCTCGFVWCFNPLEIAIPRRDEGADTRRRKMRTPLLEWKMQVEGWERVCACEHAGVYAGVHAGVHTQKPKGYIVGPDLSPAYSLEAGSLPEPGAWLASLKPQQSFCLHPTQLWGYQGKHSGFHMGAEICTWVFILLSLLPIP